MTPEFLIEEVEMQLPKIKVIGVGGAGCNAINRMIDSKIDNVEFIAVNSDYQSLMTSKASVKIQIGKNVTQGLGAGSNPDMGRQAALEDKDKLESVIKGAHMLFITAGLGGGTGTGAAPVIAQIAKELGILSVAIVTQPFLFERTYRYENFLRGLNDLKDHVDSMIILKNDKVKEIFDPKVPISVAYREIDSVLEKALRGITDMLFKPGVENVDFADLKAIFQYKGFALMGLGKAKGEDRAKIAFEEARKSPLLDDYPLSQAKGLILNLTYGEGENELTLVEMETIFNEVHKLLGTNNKVNLIKGMVQDPEVGEELRITIIATGYDYSSFLGLSDKDFPKAIDDSFVLTTGDLEVEKGEDDILLEDGEEEGMLLDDSVAEVDTADFDPVQVQAYASGTLKNYHHSNYPLKGIAESYLKKEIITGYPPMGGISSDKEVYHSVLKEVPAFVRAYQKILNSSGEPRGSVSN